MAVIALAVWQAEHEAVASVFAFTGVATAVFGLVFGQLEGTFELTATGLKARLREAQRVSAREDLTIDEKGDELVHLLSGEDAPTRETPVSAPAEADREATSPAILLPKVPPFIANNRHQVWGEFVQHVSEAFHGDNWSVSTTHGPGDQGFDLRCEKDGVRAAVEVKLYRSRLSMADARQFIGTVQLDPWPGASYVLAVPLGGLTSKAREALEGVRRAQVLEVPVVWAS
jgi:hypothetical protein